MWHDGCVSGSTPGQVVEGNTNSTEGLPAVASSKSPPWWMICHLTQVLPTLQVDSPHVRRLVLTLCVFVIKYTCTRLGPKVVCSRDLDVLQYLPLCVRIRITGNRCSGYTHFQFILVFTLPLAYCCFQQNSLIRPVLNLRERQGCKGSDPSTVRKIIITEKSCCDNMRYWFAQRRGSPTNSCPPRNCHFIHYSKVFILCR